MRRAFCAGLLVLLGLLGVLAPVRAEQASVPAPSGWLGPVRPKAAPERIVSLAPNLTEMIFALGEGARVIGVSRFDDHPPEVKALPKVGGFVDPSLEAILALKPDLVLCVPNAGNESTMRTLAERLGVAVLVLPAYTLEDVFASIERLGELLRVGARAKKLVAEMRRRMDEVRERVAERPRPRVLIVYGHQPLVAAGPGSFADGMLRLAGGDNVLADSSLRYPTLPMEQVIRLAPAVIIDASMAGEQAEIRKAEAQAIWARWRVLPAVRSGRVHLFNSALWFRPGPRIVEGLDELARLLHPLKP